MKLTVIIGSLRKESLNKQLSNIIIEKLANDIEVQYLEYANIPYMNEDIEFPTPQSILEIRNIIKASDILWVFTPEYNGQIPGVLKNLFDWLSRPEIKGDWKTGSVIKNKPVMISSVAGKSKGLGARESLVTLLTRLQMQVLSNEGISFKAGQLDLTLEELEIIDKQIQHLKSD